MCGVHPDDPRAGRLGAGVRGAGERVAPARPAHAPPHRSAARAPPRRLRPPLRDLLAALDLPAEPGAAYIAGEARTCQMARDHLVREPGWPRTTISVKPFWTPGKRGLH
ncbi:SIP domain-containing protein [Actinomadura hallensis]|uniref:SIP domain-containing protein n=1 Tax=Actinomadura hallensis TaxID=337895 RepID=UPI003CCC51B3